MYAKRQAIEIVDTQTQQAAVAGAAAYQRHTEALWHQ